MIFSKEALKPKPLSMPEIRLVSERVMLRPPTRNDWHEWAMLRSRNRAFLQPWEPTWDKDCLSEDYYERRINRLSREWRDDRGYSFLITLQSSDSIIGGININNVCRGAAQFASLGYWIDQEQQGHGYMTETLRTIIAYAFEIRKLHRVNAASLPENVKSRALLERAGFKEEGFATRYIAIDGLWRDHVLYGIPFEEWNTRDVIA